MVATIEISGRELNVDRALGEYVKKRAQKLDKFLPGVDEVKVDLAYRKSARAAEDRYKAQITLKGKTFVLRAEEKTDQVNSAFDAALEKIQRQMRRYKGKHYNNKGNEAIPTTQEIVEIEAEDEEETPTEIVRHKRFLLLPMNPAEAVEEMRLLGHENFYVFYNMEASCVSLLYQRGDGSYGLIDTEIA